MDLDDRYVISDTAALSALYNSPHERSVRKQLDRLDDYCRTFIAASPLVIIGTQNGVADNSPRGDVPGFVRVVDDNTLLIPDRRGNNRLDTLRNIVRNPAVGLLFLVPGVKETFRVNGDALLTRDPAILESFAVNGNAPRLVIVVRVKEAYMHCSRALVRADLWNPGKFAAPGSIPSYGTMLAQHTRGLVDGPALDEENRVKVPLTLY